MIKKILPVFLLAVQNIFPQFNSVDSTLIEINVIDSYITPEIPNKFVLSFFTSDSCKSKVVLINKYAYEVSKVFTDNHKIEIELNKLKLESDAIKYIIYVYDMKQNETISQEYEVELPKEIILSPEQDVSLMRVCLGGIVFAIPSISFVWDKNEKYWSLSKELPLLSFFSGGYNYPADYIGVEYSYIFHAQTKNIFRVGYKHLIQIPDLSYFSPGINYFTDFKGYSGLSSELSLGLFQLQNVFTFYVRYRYNFSFQHNTGVPFNGLTDFHEISLGLFSNFFSFNL